ncbi:GNAT family N-acetyltransferase, partial [Candidatus Gracilibacteria bacterium]|nr:GNAT family N-acetyltransferase [Candidatus Gracilibacteria bacterium]
MQIQEWDADRADVLAMLYNQQTTGVAYTYPVTPEEFVAGCAHKRVSDSSFLVAVTADQPVGFAHIGRFTSYAEGDQTPDVVGMLRFLCFAPPARATGLALVRAAESTLGERGFVNIRGFDGGGYPFYRFGFPALSAQFSHIGALLGSSGYIHQSHWESDAYVLMQCPTFAAPPLDYPTDLELRVREELYDGLLHLFVELYDQGTCIGKCLAYSLGTTNRAPDARAVFYTRTLDVAETARGKGYGRLLMQAVHWEMRRREHQHAVLYTSLTNFRAQALYASLGYRVCDTTYHWAKISNRDGNGIEEVGNDAFTLVCVVDYDGPHH